jgi:hypothetical protein
MTLFEPIVVGVPVRVRLFKITVLPISEFR